jgi:predicted aspartyl protease
VPSATIAWVGLAVACLISPALAGQCSVAKVAEMPMTFWHNRIFVPVAVNDTPGIFMLDTGAAQSMLNTGYADRAGVAWDQHQPDYTMEGVGGKQTLVLHAAHLRMLEFGGARVPDREMPISGIEMKQPSGAPVDGLLGADMVNLLDLELDFQAGKVAFWRLFDCKDISPLHWSGDYAAIPLSREASKHVDIPIWLDGAVLKAKLDTGAGGLVLDRQAAMEAGATEDQLAHDPVEGGVGVGGKVAGHIHVFHLLLIGKDVYHDVSAFVTDTSSSVSRTAALVGMTYLRNHRVWMSYGTETLFLQALPAVTAK